MSYAYIYSHSLVAMETSLIIQENCLNLTGLATFYSYLDHRKLMFLSSVSPELAFEIVDSVLYTTVLRRNLQDTWYFRCC